MTSSATAGSTLFDDQPQPPYFPEQVAPAVYTIFNTVEKSRRSDTSEGAAIGDELDPTGHTPFDLEEGSAVCVTTEPKLLGLSAATERYTLLVDPIWPRFGCIESDPTSPKGNAQSHSC